MLQLQDVKEQWHSLGSDEALLVLDSGRSGLTETEARAGLFQCGTAGH